MTDVEQQVYKRWTVHQKKAALVLYITDGPREASRRTNIPHGTISTWARAEGIRTRSAQTKLADVAATMALLEHRRIRLAERLLDEAELLADEMHEPSTVHHWDKDGGFHTAELATPTYRDRQAITTSVAILIDKAQLLTGQATQRIDVHTPDEEVAEVSGAVDELRAMRERRSA